MPTPLTAVSFTSFPFDLVGKADYFVQLRPEHFLKGYGPVLEQYQAPQIATPAEAEREGSWEPRYGVEWWPVGPPQASVAELSTPLREQMRRLRQYGPQQVDVTPEFVRALFRKP